MKPIFTSLTPNAQASDVWFALAALTAPGSWIRGKSIAELENTLAKFLGLAHVYTFDSGRTGLYAILKALNLQAGDEVLLQAYTCVAVPDPVLWAGAKPIYVDCEAETLTMSAADLEKKITPKSKVLIIQHTFGFPADLEKLMKIAKEHKLFVIEDCAHALGATYQGKQVGTFGDASFFSFGRDKVISCTFGGAVATGNTEFATKLERFANSLPYPGVGWIARQLLHPAIIGLSKSLFNILWLGKMLLYLSKVAGLTPLAVYAAEKKGGRPPFAFHRLANALASAAGRQLERLKKFNQHRVQIAQSYEVGLRKIPFGRQRALPGSAPIYLRYTIRHPKAAEILATAKKKNIFLGDWYTTAVAPTGVSYQAIGYDPKTCPNAEGAAAQSLNLPTDIHITEKEVERIINFISGFPPSRE